MREKHPIDERFKALYEAEATPPEEVHDALAGKLGWNIDGRGGAVWNRWFIMAAAAVLLITGGTYLGYRPESTSVPTLVATKNNQQRASEPGFTNVPDTPKPDDSAQGKHEGPIRTQEPVALRGGTGSPAPTRPSTWSERSSTSSAPKAVSRTIESRSTTGAVNNSSAGTLRNGASPSQRRPKADHEVEPVLAAFSSTQIEEPPVYLAPPASMSDGQATWMPTRAVYVEREFERSLRSQAIDPAYVLAPGSWFVGLAIGVGRMSATWRADDQAALTEAELWRGSTIWGVDFGREWRSGWSVSSGLGLALDRSTFAAEMSEVERFTDVDTSWTQTAYNNTEDLIYTWSIDTVEVERPGTTRTAQANNLYGAIRFPLTVGWHTDLRRWRFGAFTGVTALIPSQRQGSTLYRPADDADAIVVDLTDPRVDDRFGPRMNMHAGLSLGYHFSEHLTILAEPLLSLPASDLGGSRAPWMRGHFFQFRLQHVFGASIR